MEKKTEQFHPDRWLKDLPAREKDEFFKPEEMIPCPKCRRQSPPNRLKCFYCNADLPLTETKFNKLSLRKLESWEKGFNVILLPEKSDSGEINFPEIARFLSLDEGNLKEIYNLNKALPIARAESEREAEIIRERLKEYGAEAFILSDDRLNIDTPARRLRSIEFSDDKLILILFNADKVEELLREDLCLIVSGALFEKKIESIEKYDRKKENKILESTELSADESLIDIYSRKDSIGWRVAAKGFDFSCLGSKKNLLAKENIKILVEKLRAFAPQARFDSDYRQIRGIVSQIWEIEQRKDSKGVRKKGIGKVNLESVTTADNLSQFTKYSRLQWHLL